jgi:hypothetical protein
VVVEGAAAEGEEDLVPPAAVGGGRGVEEDGDQGPDVLDTGCLEVELGDHGVSRVVPGSRSSGRGVEGGGGAVFRVDGLAGGDAEVAFRLGDPESEGVGCGALVFPGEGCHTDPLLGHRCLRLGGKEGRGESGVGLLPSESGCGERHILGRHPEARPCDIGRCINDGLRAHSDSSAVGHSGGGGSGARGRQQLHCGPQGGRIDGGARLGSRSPGAAPAAAAAAAASGCRGPRVAGGCGRGPCAGGGPGGAWSRGAAAPGAGTPSRTSAAAGKPGGGGPGAQIGGKSGSRGGRGRGEGREGGEGRRRRGWRPAMVAGGGGGLQGGERT